MLKKLFIRKKENWETLQAMYDEKTWSYKPYWQKYKRLSEELVLQIPSEQLYTVIADFVFYSLKLYDYYDVAADEQLKKVNQLCRNVFYIYQLESEVNNGGFNQYFFNSAGYYAMETVEALNFFGLDKTKEMLETALNLLFTKISKSQYKTICAERKLPAEAFEAELGELDSRFYEVPENIGETINAYLDSHRKDLIANP